MKIATLNINSINPRLANLCTWLNANQPDVMFLQEIKCEFNNFPFFELQTLGYDIKILGQKSYNGVAVLCKKPHKIKVTAENLPAFTDENSRYLECEVKINNRCYTVASIYLPNGNPPQNNPQDTTKFSYKLQWMDSFLQHAETLLNSNRNIILGGDFNVIMNKLDVYNEELFINDALYKPEVRKRLLYLSRLGYCDTYRTLYPKQSGYTFWDYNAGSLQNDLGLRIDYIFTSPSLTDKLLDCRVDKDFRRLEKPSDHTILIAEFED